MGEHKSVIAEWYKGRSVFVTGGTGFMGKVLLFKLLFGCPEIDNIYVLMRPKRGKSIDERLKAMLLLPIFERIQITCPEVLKKIKPVDGDLSSDGLGLSQNNIQNIVESVSVVFHLAATLRLEAGLKDAIELNLAGTQRVVDMSKKIKNLVAFIHLSTAFCSADIDVFEEKVYDSPDDPRDVIHLMKWINNDALKKATPDLIKPHPNTYTYSKRLAETLVANEAANMRVAIVRPSIVTPAGVDPMPGWVDSLNGPMGVLAGAGKGVIRSMNCKGENHCHVVPVDIAINGIIVAAWKLGSAPEQPKEVPVYNMTNDGVIQSTWNEVLNLGRKHFYKYPFEMQIWYPDGNIRSSYAWHLLCTIFMHWIPALLIDTLLFIFRQKRFMIRLQHKIHNGLELLQFFTTREWVFPSERFLSLVDELNPVDKEMFMMDFKRYTMDEYMVYSILGTRHYCLKENPKSMTRCRIQQKILYVVHKLFVFMLYYGLFCIIWSHSDSVKYIFDYVGSYVKTIPVLGKIVPES